MPAGFSGSSVISFGGTHSIDNHRDADLHDITAASLDVGGGTISCGTINPSSIGGASGGYTVPMYSGGNNLSLKYDGGLDLPVIRVDATDFACVRAGGYTGSTVTHGGYVEMKDASGTTRKFMVGT